MIAKTFETAAEMAGRFDSADDAARYIRAGKATITLRSTKTQARYTFEIERHDKDNKFQYVRVLTGGDNDGDYQYMGIIDERGNFKRTKRSAVAETAISYLAFDWSWQQLAMSKRLPKTLEVWHEGSCGRCGRKLTVPESIADGLGPECRKKSGG